MKPYTYHHAVPLLILVSVIIFNYSCGKKTAMDENPPPPVHAAPNLATFWAVNPYGDDDDYWIFPTPFYKVEIAGVTLTSRYTLKESAAPLCNDPHGVTFSLDTGAYHWKATMLSNGLLINQGTIQIRQGQCLVTKIVY